MATDAAGSRPKIREIVTPEDLKGMATDAGMSDEAMGKLLGPFLGLSAGGGQMVAAAGEAINEHFGFKIEKSTQATLACAYPVAVRALVHALSSERRAITTAFDTPKGAYFEAALPTDIWSSGGTLELELAEEGPDQVILRGVSEIGQAYDWGKGKPALAGVMEKAEDFARRLGA